MSVVTDLQELLDTARVDLESALALPVEELLTVRAAGQRLRDLSIPLARTVLTLHAALRREHNDPPVFDIHVKGQEKGTLPPCDTCAALKLPDLAEAMKEAKG